MGKGRRRPAGAQCEDLLWAQMGLRHLLGVGGHGRPPKLLLKQGKSCGTQDGRPSLMDAPTGAPGILLQGERTIGPEGNSLGLDVPEVPPEPPAQPLTWQLLPHRKVE